MGTKHSGVSLAPALQPAGEGWETRDLSHGHRRDSPCEGLECVYQGLTPLRPEVCSAKWQGQGWVFGGREERLVARAGTHPSSVARVCACAHSARRPASANQRGDCGQPNEQAGACAGAVARQPTKAQEARGRGRTGPCAAAFLTCCCPGPEAS